MLENASAWMLGRLSLAAMVMFFTAAPSSAQNNTPNAASVAPASCAAITISVSFKMEDAVYNKLKNDFDQRLFLLDRFVRQQNIKKFEIQNMSYDLYLDDGQGNMNRTGRYQGGYGGQANYNGNASYNPSAKPTNPVYRLEGMGEYHINSSDSAFKIGQFLTQQKFEVTVSNKTDPSKPCKPVSPPAPAVQAPALAPAAAEGQGNVKSVLEAKPPGDDTAMPVQPTENNGPKVLAIPVLDAPPPDSKQ